MGTVEPLLSKAFVDAFAWRSSPNKRKDRVWDPPPGSSLFLTRCNLLAGSLLSTHLGFLHIAAKIHFRAHWLNAVVRHWALSRGFPSSWRTNAGPTSDPGNEQRLQGRAPSASSLSSSQCLVSVCYKTVFIGILIAFPTPNFSLPVAPCQWPLAAAGINAVFIPRSPLTSLPNAALRGSHGRTSFIKLP